jgi:hypothetical protein
MIMLSAVAHAAQPALADAFDADVRAFHAALTKDRESAVSAAGKLAVSARALADGFAAHAFSRADNVAALRNVLEESQARYTDYAGGAQAVMAVDTLVNAMVSAGQLSRQQANGLRPQIDRLYADVRDPNAWRPVEFRAAIEELAVSVRKFN